MRLCEPKVADETPDQIGRMSFMESLFVLDREPKELGFDKSIVFFSTRPYFHYKVPDDLIDITSGVFCCPNNFDYPEPLAEGMLRLTNMAQYKLWDDLARTDYRSAKKEQGRRTLRSRTTPPSPGLRRGCPLRGGSPFLRYSGATAGPPLALPRGQRENFLD